MIPFISYLPSIIKLIGTESRMVVAMHWEVGGWKWRISV